MSSKIVNASNAEIKKSFAAISTTHISQRNKADFKLKRFTAAKSQFSTATLCADPGTVFAAFGTQE